MLAPKVAFTLLLFGILAVPSFRMSPKDWETVYLPASQRLANGADIFQNGFVYPPINALMTVPLIGLSGLSNRIVFYGLNMISLAVLIWGAWKLSGGRRLDRRTSWREYAIFALGLGCGISSCFDVITNQQTDLIVAALVVLGGLALVAGRDLRAGLWLGIAAGIKCTPLLWAPYLAWRKKWLAAATVAVAAILLNLLPDVFYTSPASKPFLEDWTARHLLPMAHRNNDFGTWYCGLGGNQAVAGLWQRWLIYEPAWRDREVVGTMSPDRAAPETLKLVTGSICLFLLAAALVGTWRDPGAASASKDPPSAPSAWGLQMGLVLILMLLLSPHSSKPHFCTLVLPGFCIARAALHGTNRKLQVGLATALTLALVSNADLVGKWFYSWVKWHGSLTWCALALFACSCGVLLERRRPEGSLAEKAPISRNAA